MNTRSFCLNNIVITVGSVTYSIKLKRLFLREGISSSLIKLDTTGSGCTHGLVIAESDFYSAVAIMRNQNIKYEVVKKENDIS